MEQKAPFREIALGSEMTRRAAVQRLALVLGGTLIAPSILLESCSRAVESVGTGDPERIAFLNAIADTILPRTAQSGGAADANVGAFIDLMLADCYSQEHRDAVNAGLVALDEAADAAAGTTFTAASAFYREDILKKVDEERSKAEGLHYFSVLRELTLLGYFTSEIGCTEALDYQPVPGRYDGAAPVTEETRLMA